MPPPRTTIGWFNLEVPAFGGDLLIRPVDEAPANPQSRLAVQRVLGPAGPVMPATTPISRPSARPHLTSFGGQPYPRPAGRRRMRQSHHTIKSGSSGRSVFVFIRSNASEGVTGLRHDTAGLAASFVRDGGEAAPVALVRGTAGAHR